MIAYITGTSTSSISNAAARYQFIQGSGVSLWSTTYDNQSVVIPHAMTIDHLSIVVATAPGSGKSRSYTLYKNGSSTSLTCTISDTSTAASDTVNSVSFSAGDTAALHSSPTGTPDAPGEQWWCMRQEATGMFALFSGDSTANNSSTIYNPVQGSTTGATAEADISAPIPTAGSLENLYIKTDTAPTSGRSWAVTLRVGAADTALTASIADAATGANDTSNSVAISAGDLAAVKVVPTSAPVTSPIHISMSFVPTTDGESFLTMMNPSFGPSTTQTQYDYPLGEGAGSWSTTESTRQLLFGEATATAMYMKLDAAPSSGKSYAFTLRNNAADTDVTVTVADANTTGSITGQSVALADDDLIALKSVPTGVPTGAQVGVGILFEDGVTEPPAASPNGALTMLGVG